MRAPAHLKGEQMYRGTGHPRGSCCMYLCETSKPGDALYCSAQLDLSCWPAAAYIACCAKAAQVRSCWPGCAGGLRRLLVANGVRGVRGTNSFSCMGSPWALHVMVLASVRHLCRQVDS
jgi:hypothetical protein